MSAFADKHFGLAFHVSSNSSPISVNLWTFIKNAFTSLLSKKCKTLFHGLGQDDSCIDFLEVSDFEVQIIQNKRTFWIVVH